MGPAAGEAKRTPSGHVWLALCAITLAIAVKVALLFTSQSMADGDEAVEGLMAMHILQQGVHPIYPYGVTYGAGAGVEAHLAALLFLVFGVSDITLKAAGLLVWLGSLGLVWALGQRIGGRSVGLVAALLFACAPQAAHWSLKVAGGHQVAVLCGLGAALLVERQRFALAAALAPLVAFAHPIALPFAGAVALLALIGARGRARFIVAAALVVSAAVSALVLWPAGSTVWNPAGGLPDLAKLGAILPRLAATLHTPNLSAHVSPGGAILAVSLVWLGLLAIAMPTAPRRLWVYFGAALAPVLLADARLLVARHLLLAYPLGCLVLAASRTRGGDRLRVTALAVLATSGLAIQVVETRSPYVFGAGPQSRGLERAQVRGLVERLEEAGVRHVYSFDPMLQWNLAFESRERIVARWRQPRDRIPAYVARVDAARRAGDPVALVGELPPVDRSGPQKFDLILRPDRGRIEQAFPPAESGGR